METIFSILLPPKLSFLSPDLNFLASVTVKMATSSEPQNSGLEMSF